MVELKIKKEIEKEENIKLIVVCLVSCLLFMLIAHGFLLLNPSFSHDSLYDLVRSHDTYQFSIGRFGQKIWCAIFGELTSTWFIGIVSAVAFGLGEYMIAKVLKLRRITTLVILSGILITNYTISNSVATYMPWVDIYGGAFFFSVTAVWMAMKYRFGFCYGIPLIIFALSLYQPYVLCAPALIVCVLLIDSDMSWRSGLCFLAKMLVMLLISFFLYRIALHVILQHFQIDYSHGYNSITNVGVSSLIMGNLRGELVETYRKFFFYLFASFNCLPFPKCCAFLTILSAIVESLFFIHEYYSTDFIRSIVFLFLLILSPLVFNIQCLISKDAYHVLMVYSIYFSLVFLIAIHEKTKEKRSYVHSHEGMSHLNTENILLIIQHILLPFVLAVLIFANIKYANAIYTEKYLRERSTLSVMTRIMARAEAVDGYIPGEMPVVVIGNIEENPSIGLTPSEFLSPEIGDSERFVSITYDIKSYLKYYLGYSNLGDVSIVTDWDTVNSMPCFPENGFAQVIDQALIIKLTS